MNLGMHDRCAGFTFLEVTVVIAMLGLAMGAAVSLFGTADGLVAESRAHLRAVAENREGLASIAKVLRDADPETLGGFDLDGQSSNPTFHRVVGSDSEGLLHGSVEELRWVPTSNVEAGVAEPGAVYHLSGGTQKPVAKRVVAGGLLVQRLGDALVIRLRTYYTTRERRTVVVEGETAVSSRN